MEGYYQNEKETAEAISPDGWFKTGDIGEWDKNGHLKVIDRKKNLVKTLNGEYVALEKLESVYRAATVVANICVYANEQKTKPVAIIVPAEPALMKLAERIGVEGHGVEDLVHNTKVQDAVLKELQQAGRAGGLSGIEIIEGAILADEEWTPQNVGILDFCGMTNADNEQNMVTSAQKLNRKLILQTYKKKVDAAYARGG